jgi:hypothetical protein
LSELFSIPKKKAFSTFVSFEILLYDIYVFTNNKLVWYLAAGLGFLAFGYMLLNVKKIHLRLIIIGIIYFYFAGMVLVLRQRDFSLVLSIPGSVAFAIVIIDGNVNKKQINYLFFLVFFLIIYRFIRIGGPEGIYPVMSRNYLVFHLFVHFILILLFSKENEKFLILLCVIAILVVSIISLGRTSMVLGGLLTLIMFLYKKILNWKVLLVVGLFLAAFLFIYRDRIITIWNTYYLMTNFAQRNVDQEPRFKIWSIYLSKMNPITFFFGYDTTGDSFLSLYHNNLHNSYFYLHSMTGIFAFIFYFIFIKSINLWRKISIFLALVLLSLFFRAFFDMLAFPGPFDMIILAFIFYPILYAKKGEHKCVFPLKGIQ